MIVKLAECPYCRSGVVAFDDQLPAPLGMPAEADALPAFGPGPYGEQLELMFRRVTESWRRSIGVIFTLDGSPGRPCEHLIDVEGAVAGGAAAPRLFAWL